MSAHYERAACALVTCTRSGEIVCANRTLRAWLGAEEEAEPVHLTTLLTSASLLFFELQLRPLLALGRPVEGAFLTLRHMNGSTVPVLLNAVPSPDGEFVELALLIVREREQYEATLRQSHADAERALAAMAASAHGQKIQAVGQMAGGIAHEFNNLLAVVRGNLTFAQKDLRDALPLDTRIQGDLQSALDATDRAAAIVRQLLAYTGRQVVRRTRLDLNRAVLDAAQLLVPALGRDVSWQVQLSHDVWPVLAPADQVQHVITSLVLNARDAVHARGTPGVIRVISSNVPGGPGSPDLVTLVVEDTGVGMDAQVVARAFDPFFTTKPVGQGVGLGLSMVYGTIEALGGRTTIASAPGEGTRVTITLPRANDLTAA